MIQARKAVLVCIVVGIIALALGVSIGRAEGSKTLTTTEFQITSPNTIITITKQVIVTQEECGTDQIELYNITTYLLPRSYPSEFYATVLTVITSQFVTTITYSTFQSITTYNGTTRSLTCA